MKYKKGDRVKVREDLKEGKIYNGLEVTVSMVKLYGEIVTIENVGCEQYEITELADFGWTDEMFSGLADEQIQTEPIRPEPDRTMIAAMTMQGYISHCKVISDDTAIYASKFAVRCADALITELNKPKP